MANFFRLFLVLFIFMKNAGTGGNPWKHVTGLTNGFVDLIFPKSISQYLKEAQLKVIKKSGTFKIGDFKNKNLVGYSEFENRLEILGGGNGLRVKNLTLEDSTVYQAMITLQDSTLHIVFFNVTVYEPVPDPTITTSCEKGKGNEHNVTIHCSVATNTKSLSFNWKYRHNGSDFQPINSAGDTIHMSLQPEYPNIEVQCIVQNPADSKSVTLMLGGDPLKHVTALTNEFVDLSFPTNILQSVEEVQWKVTWGPETQKIADFKDNNLVVGYAPFKNRLKFLSGGIGLRITNPRLEDSGIYQFMITLENYVLRYESFNVTVYEPVPDPTITTSCEKGKGNEHNITIHCSVPTNAISLSFTWKQKHNGVDFQPINATGDTIHMSLQPEYPNIEVQCIVQNPADSKNVTLMLGLCHSRNHWPIIASALVVIALSIGVIYALLLPRQLPKSHVQYNKNKPDDNLKISIMETNTAISLETKYPKTEEEPFQVSENGVKYSKYDYIPVSAGKLDIAITESKAE